jgi:hypothetical protein
MTPAWKFALVVLILLLVNTVPGLVVPPHIWLPWRVISWILTIAMLLLALGIVGTRMTKDWRGVLVDRRNVMSMSRLQLVMWTVLIVSAILTSGIANVAAGVTDPLLLKVPPEIWELLGISGTAFVATPLFWITRQRRYQPMGARNGRGRISFWVIKSIMMIRLI